MCICGYFYYRLARQFNGVVRSLKGVSSIGVMNLFIANMAVADLMLTCTVMPVQVDFTHGDVLGFREYWES